MLALLAGTAAPCWAQLGGTTSRGIKPKLRGKPSGLPSYAKLTDVAAQASLRVPVVCGGIDKSDYIIEAMSCAVAFLDYDNDGWLDIFDLSGSRFDPAPTGAANLLYRNNRDGTFTGVSARSGVGKVSGGYGLTAVAADFDTDGDMMAYIRRFASRVSFAQRELSVEFFVLY